MKMFLERALWDFEKHVRFIFHANDRGKMEVNMQSSHSINIGKSKNQVKPVYNTAYFSFFFLEVLYVKGNGHYSLFECSSSKPKGLAL